MRSKRQDGTVMILRTILFAALFSAATSGMSAEIREDISDAKQDDVSARDITRQLVDRGEHPANVAQAVSEIYGSCDDIASSVSEAVEGRREYLESVVSSVSALGECGCSADSLWSRTRLESRLRLPSTRLLVELDPSMACAAVAAESASYHFAEDSGLILEAAMQARQPQSIPYDSFGTLTKGNQAPAQAYKRQSFYCSNDRDLSDEFEQQDRWMAFSPGSLPQADWTPDCDEDDEYESEDRDGTDTLLITEVAMPGSGGSYVALYNGTDQPQDLKQSGISLSVFFNGAAKPGLVVPLEGVIPSRGHFVVGGSRFDENQIDQVESGFKLSPNDSVAITPPVVSYNCDGIRSVFGGALRGAVQIDDADENSHLVIHPRELVKNKVARQFGALQGKTPGYVADAVGQVPLDEDDLPIALLDNALTRQTNQCQPDSNETDTFAGSSNWTSTAGASLGKPNNQCRSNWHDGVLISELANGEDQQDAVEIYNGGQGTIDLGEEGYFLEIYRGGNEQPDEIVTLEGKISPEQIFLIANNDVDDSIQDLADQLTDEIVLDDATAVLLVRQLTPGGRQCRNSIAGLLTLENVPNVVYVPGPDRTPEPPRVDPIASPN